MHTTSVPANLLVSLAAILTISLALAPPTAWSQEDAISVAVVDTGSAAEEPAEQPATEEDDVPSAVISSGHSQSIMSFQQAIEAIESSHGAYGSELSESLAGLAQNLQLQGRHDEAVDLFKRSIHLARINEGLYCPQQIPLLQGEIASHKAMQNYAEADERQNYLYRVQRRSMQGSEAMTSAFMEQAKWQYDAYQLGLDPKRYTRLMDMWDIYGLAMQDVIAREGEESPNLLPPLRGMLHTQYLISSYDLRPTEPVFGDEERIDEDLLRFKRYYSRSFQQGNAVIEAIADIAGAHTAPGVPSMAETLVMLGDWQLWNGNPRAAWEAYRAAEAELAHSDGAQSEARQLLAQPVALPDIPELDAWPPVVTPEDADVTLAFAVSDSGRVRDIQRLDESEAEDRQVARLMAQLRSTRFRPRFEAGKPVETDQLVKAFDIIP